jgi:hypothetical protein
MDTREPTGATATLPAPDVTTGSSLADAARERVAEAASSKKEAAAEKIDTVAEVLHDAGQRLQEDMGIGRYAESAARQVDHLAHYLRRSDFGGMVRDAETFARRHPELFLGLAFLGGMVAARFLKSAPPAPERAERF